MVRSAFRRSTHVRADRITPGRMDVEDVAEAPGFDHGCRAVGLEDGPTLRDAASSAVSCGNSPRSSSVAVASASEPTTVATAILVARMHGTPPMTRWSTEIRSKAMLGSCGGRGRPDSASRSGRR